jgi:hypothetical protein
MNAARDRDLLTESLHFRPSSAALNYKKGELMRKTMELQIQSKTIDAELAVLDRETRKLELRMDELDLQRAPTPDVDEFWQDAEDELKQIGQLIRVVDPNRVKKNAISKLQRIRDETQELRVSRDDVVDAIRHWHQLAIDPRMRGYAFSEPVTPRRAVPSRQTRRSNAFQTPVRREKASPETTPGRRAYFGNPGFPLSLTPYT